MNILHLASFQGNLGDIVNHTSFYRQFKKTVCSDLSIDYEEIRDYYRIGNKRFDETLLERINKSDVLIIGGGCFFDVRIDESMTGTTLDFSNDFVDRIEVPVIVNAIGAMVDKECSLETIERFSLFVEKISKKNNWFIRVRNDGSKEIIDNCLGRDSNFSVVPDAGFFFNDHLTNQDNTVRAQGKRTVGLCVTNDLFDMAYNRNITTDEFNNSISKLIVQMIDQGINIIFFPHTPQDLDTIIAIKAIIGAKPFRKGISIAPYNPYELGGVFDVCRYYDKCDVIVAMRFHANILALSKGIPVIGLAGHCQIEKLYEELGIRESCVIAGECGYEEKIMSMISAILDNGNKPKQYDHESLQNSYEKYMLEMREFLISQNRIS